MLFTQIDRKYRELSELNSLILNATRIVLERFVLDDIVSKSILGAFSISPLNIDRFVLTRNI